MRFSSQATQISRNKLLLHSGLILTGALCIPVAQATTYDFTTIAMASPYGNNTSVYGINDNGAIVGDSGGSGFLYNAGKFTTINVPGAIYSRNTSATGINNSGEIVGHYRDYGPYTAAISSESGFSYTAGTFTTINVPQAFTDSNPIPGISTTSVAGINNHGDIVGSYAKGYGFRGYMLSGNQYTTINFTNNSATRFNTLANGINDKGVVVGSYFDGSSPYSSHGFVKNGGTYTTLEAPGQTGTIAYGINHNGAIVGAYNAPTVYGNYGSYVGFVDNGGNYTALKVPGAESTIAYGINNKGVIVGSYTTNNGNFGFMATPVPEPSILAQLGVGLVMMGSLQYLRRRYS